MKKLLSIMIMLLVVVSTSIVVNAGTKESLGEYGSWECVKTINQDPMYDKIITYYLINRVQSEKGNYALMFALSIENGNPYPTLMYVVPDPYIFYDNSITYRIDKENAVEMGLFPVAGNRSMLKRGITEYDFVIYDFMNKLMFKQNLKIATEVIGISSDSAPVSKRQIVSFNIQGFAEAFNAAMDDSKK